MSYLRQSFSAYLATPNPASPNRPSWDGFRTSFIEVKRHNPRLLSRSLIILAVWCTGVAILQSATGLSKGLTAVPWASGDSTGVAPKPAAGARLASSIPAPTLPGGPTGQLLPPGTLAPDKTYPNTYVRGQCTWYVASRRPIPPHWGNARSWYYHAAASGWSVGTVPAVAAVAWTPAGRYGHVALVEQVSADGSKVYISEMNYRGVGVKSFRWVSSKQFKYIY